MDVKIEIRRRGVRFLKEGECRLPGLLYADDFFLGVES